MDEATRRPADERGPPWWAVRARPLIAPFLELTNEDPGESAVLWTSMRLSWRNLWSKRVASPPRGDAPVVERGVRPEDDRVLAKPGSQGAPYPALTALIRNFSATRAPPHTLILGDSVMERVAREDTDTRTLGEMISAAIAPDTSDVISASANNPSVYNEILKTLSILETQPARLILPINIRCFSPQWHLNPDWAMTQEMAILRAYRADRGHAIAPIADVYRDDDAHAALSGLVLDHTAATLNRMGEFRALAGQAPSPERARNIFAFHYGFTLDDSHPKLADLKACVGHALATAEAPVVYITPVNVQAARRHADDELLRRIRENIGVLRRCLHAEVMDWHDALGEEAFFHGDTATEHLNQHGRRQLAQRIADRVRLTPGSGASGP